MSCEEQGEQKTNEEKAEPILNVQDARQRAKQLIPRRDHTFEQAASMFAAIKSTPRAVTPVVVESTDEEEDGTPRTSDVLVLTVSKAMFEALRQQRRSSEGSNPSYIPPSMEALGQS